MDEVANYESFLRLLEMIDIARSRKYDLLSLIEDANTLAIDLLPFGQEGEDNRTSGAPIDHFSKLSPPVKTHIMWLHQSLQRTNLVLDAAMNTFRTLFGNSFPLNGSLRQSNNKIAQDRLKEKLEAVLTDCNAQIS